MEAEFIRRAFRVQSVSASLMADSWPGRRHDTAASPPAALMFQFIAPKYPMRPASAGKTEKTGSCGGVWASVWPTMPWWLRLLPCLAALAAGVRLRPTGEAFAELPEDLALRVVGLVPPRFAWSPGSGALGLWPRGALVDPWAPAASRRLLGVSFFLCGERVLLTGDDGTGAIWNARTETTEVTLHGGHAHGASIFSARVFPDGSRVVTLGSDHFALVWSAASGEVLQRLDLGSMCGPHREVRVLARDRVVTGVSSFVTDAPVVWDASGGNPVRILRSFGGKVVLLEATHSGEKVAVVDDYAGVHLWDASTWVLHRLDAPGARSPIQSFDISHSGALVVGKWWSTVFVWSGTTGSLLQRFSLPQPVTAIAVLPRGDQAVVATTGQVVLVDLKTGRTLRALPEGFVNLGDEGFSMSVSDRAVVVCGESHAMARHEDTSAHFLITDITQAYYRSADVTARLWDLDTGRLVHAVSDSIDSYGVGRGCSVSVSPC